MTAGPGRSRATGPNGRYAREQMPGESDPREASRDELLALADELLAEARRVRDQWAELHQLLRGDESDAPARREQARREPSQPDTDPRRLVAVEMMLAGRSREDIEAHLRREFGPRAAAEVLAAVYAEEA